MFLFSLLDVSNLLSTSVCHFERINLTTWDKFPLPGLALVHKLYRCPVGFVLAEGLMILKTKDKEPTWLGVVSKNPLGSS